MSQNKQHGNQENPRFLQDMVEAVQADVPSEDEYIAAQRNLLQQLTTDSKENLIMSTTRKIAHTKTGWTVAAVLAIVLIAVFAVLNPFGNTPNQAYAAVAEQLRNTVTVSFRAAWYFGESETPTYIEAAFREPGLQRMVMDLDGALTIQILDANEEKGIVLVPDTKTYVEIDLENMSSIERERIQLIRLINEQLKSLPSQADEILEIEIVDGRELHGFRVGNNTMWLDAETGELDYIEQDLGGTQMVMSDFRLDPDDLEDSMFDISPPADYVSVINGAIIDYDVSNSGEKDLIEFLRLSSMMIKGHEFPSTTNPMELLSLQQQGKLIESELNSQDDQDFAQAFASVSPKSVTFVMQMRPENDWHYAGGGVKYGESDIPIAWWKPEGAAMYRVIWGDLSVSNAASADVSHFGENDR